jgi:hypothetical protein
MFQTRLFIKCFSMHAASMFLFLTPLVRYSAHLSGKKYHAPSTSSLSAAREHSNYVFFFPPSIRRSLPIRWLFRRARIFSLLLVSSAFATPNSSLSAGLWRKILTYWELQCCRLSSECVANYDKASTDT